MEREKYYPLKHQCKIIPHDDVNDEPVKQEEAGLDLTFMQQHHHMNGARRGTRDRQHRNWKQHRPCSLLELERT